MAYSMCATILDSVRNCKPSILLPSKTPVSGIRKENSSHDVTIVRRSANYHPTIWHYDYIQSLRSEYVGETFKEKVDKLKGEVTMMFHKVVVLDPLEQLKLIDVLQRLGVSYHFKDEIRSILGNIYNTHHSGDHVCKKQSLYATALEFRLLRQHGYKVPQETFKSFTDENGDFKECLCNNTEEVLALYEASFLSIEGESILEEARHFATKHLKDYVEKSKDQNLQAMVNHALELPLHWRMIRLEARWFIDVYSSREDLNPSLLEFARLDFNMVQAVHQEDLKAVSRWWESTSLGELSFVRDRVVESFLWAVGISFEPQFGYERRMLTRLVALLTSIDDVYDVYGTLDELELFTDVVERWDINAMEQLPHYMQICFLTIYNSINEIAFNILKEKGFNSVRYLKREWADLCRSYLLEAKNAWITITGPNMLVHSFFFVTNPITKEALDLLEEYPDIIRWIAVIVRLADDLGTSTDEIERGDNPKSIQCYMNDTGASEKDAREFIRSLISATWKKVNEELGGTASSSFSETFIEIGMNCARMSQCMYQHGDGHGIVDRETKDRVLALLIHPIPIPED
uniref:TPS46 n=1 Tax=Juglans sigillata TaxID=224355 RepID=A0A8K1B0I3_9ROSI|nr:TPS46 [Juglans sigillata]